jgi:putative nucleotidyltransferase with HDIG domain
MQPDDSIDRNSHYASPDQLRIGMYVHVDLPWFLHPFTRSSFRISTEEQIASLRALSLQRIRYDPLRSEESSDEACPAASDEPAEPIAEEPIAEEPAAEVPPRNGVHGNPVQAKLEERMLRSHEHRRVLAQTEKAFIKATTIMRSVSKSILRRPEEALEEINGLVGEMASAFLGSADVSLRVMGEKCGGEEAYFHGLNVCVLSLMLAKKLDLSEEQTRMLAVGALLHDIGQIEIPDRVLKRDPREFTGTERALYVSHVESGRRIGRKLGLAPGVLSVIAQHHELADGSGYPHALKLEQIAPLARVVALVNLYDNLCNPVVLHLAMTPHEALSFIFARRRDKFDERVLQFLIRALGVYPPGSIVKLSDQTIAMVVSVNPQTALRPWVMLYQQDVPKDEAIMLDLERETKVSIAKSLQPATLPPAVYAYLSARRRISYFFDSEMLSREGRA